MELLQAHEADVVVWMVHNGHKSSRDVSQQLRALGAERRSTAFIAAMLHYINMDSFPKWPNKHHCKCHVCFSHLPLPSLSSLCDMLLQHCLLHLEKPT